MLEQKSLHLAFCLRHGRREPHQRGAVLANVLRAFGRGAGDPRPRLVDGVLDEAGYDAARQFVDHSLPFETGIKSRDFGQQAAGETDAGDVVQFEQAGAQPIVDVVSVVGDVVGDRGRLRLGAGKERQLQRKQRVEFKNIGVDPPFRRRPRQRTVVLDQSFQGLP